MNGANDRIGDEIILERMYAAEQVLLSQADALDMKASYLLVALVFLAQLSITFLSNPNLTCLAKGGQWLSCLLLFLAGVFLLLELRIKTFRAEDAKDLEAWRDRVVKEGEDQEGCVSSPLSGDYLRSRLVWGLIESSKPRIVAGERNNGRKVAHLNWAYWLTLVAFFLDIVCIIPFSRFY